VNSSFQTIDIQNSKNIKLSKIHVHQQKDKTLKEEKIHKKINEIEKEMQELHFSQKVMQNNEPKLYYHSNLSQISSLP
jgi:hypothetical protein